MSVEKKIKELLGRTGQQSLTEESKENLAAAGMADTGAKAAAGMSRDMSKAGKPANAGDTTQPRQGNSKDASFNTRDEDDQNPGAKVAAGISKNSLPDNKGDAKSVKVASMEETEVEDPVLAECVEIASLISNYTPMNEYFDREHIGSTKNFHVHSVDPEQGEYELTHKKTGKKTTVSVGDEWPNNSTKKIKRSIHGEVPNSDIHSIARKINKHLQGDEAGEVRRSMKEEEVDVSSQLNSIFGEELSEEFKQKATSIFEAAVIARVNSEMDKVAARLEEQNEAQLQEFKESLVEKVDSYLNYIVEQWMEENQLQVENGLRTEIAEDFISGLKGLFQEHYIEVPEDKYDVLDELQTKASDLEAKLNEEIEKNIAASNELADLKAAIVFEEQTKDLAATEVEKLKKLVEGVEFENEDLFREKISVIKENYFPKAQKTSPEKVLIEESGVNQPAPVSGSMDKYVQALSRSLKVR